MKNGLWIMTLVLLLATKVRGIAMKGGLNFTDNRFEDAVVAFLDQHGCAVVTQKVRGPFSRPEIGNINILKSLTSPVTNLLRSVVKLFGSRPCDVFYSGSVAPPAPNKLPQPTQVDNLDTSRDFPFSGLFPLAGQDSDYSRSRRDSRRGADGLTAVAQPKQRLPRGLLDLARILGGDEQIEAVKRGFGDELAVEFLVDYQCSDVLGGRVLGGARPNDIVAGWRRESFGFSEVLHRQRDACIVVCGDAKSRIAFYRRQHGARFEAADSFPAQAQRGTTRHHQGYRQNRRAPGVPREDPSDLV
jgi:hypothetical protein